MNEVVSCQLRGGLGNWMFQIAVCEYIKATQSKTPLIATSDIQTVHTNLDEYKDNIFRKVNFAKPPSYDHYLDFSNTPLDYVPIPEVKGNLKLTGYFQNEDYFNPIREKILNLFEIDTITKEKLYNKYDFISKPKVCSIHVRRGNYLKLQHVHPVQSLEYYQKCIANFDSDTLFIIFSDDLSWCKENFNYLSNKLFIEGNKDYEDLYLMSLCKNNIIANSSFSWWGAFLNQNPNKKVYYPSMWFNPSVRTPKFTGAKTWIKI